MAFLLSFLRRIKVVRAVISSIEGIRIVGNSGIGVGVLASVIVAPSEVAMIVPDL